MDLDPAPTTGEEHMWATHDSSMFGDPGQFSDLEEAEMRRVEEEMDIVHCMGTPLAIGKELSGDLFEEPEAQEENPENNDDAVLASILRNIGFDSLQERMTQNKPTHSNAEWYPYESKTLFLLDTLDNLPRLRISDSLMRVFLWVLKESGGQDVPSFTKLCSVQESLGKSCGIPTIPCKSSLGTDWSNPHTCKHIHLYPEIPEQVISEVWHASKWHDMDPSLMSPMFVKGHIHFYVNELAQLRSGEYIMPIQWVVFKGIVHCHSFLVKIDEEGTANVRDQESVLISTEDLLYNYHDLKHQHRLPTFNERSEHFKENMPNPDRLTARGPRPTLSWNKHNNAYITHRNLPRDMINKESHIHFISTSQHASVQEQFDDFKQITESTLKNPAEVRDGVTGEDILFRILPHLDPSDNPMQSTICGHMVGAGANHPCRKCNIGGDQAFKASDEGFESYFHVMLACTGRRCKVGELQTNTGVKDTLTQYWIKDLLTRFVFHRKEGKTKKQAENILLKWVSENRDKIYSPFLTCKGLDPSKDTPIELLHMILLGILKYVWHMTMSDFKPEHKSKFGIRLQATNIDGLSIPPIRSKYIMQYSKSLIGRQLKTVLQTSIFHLHDLTTSIPNGKGLRYFAICKAIEKLEEYLSDLCIAVANVLDAFGAADPEKITAKIKLHLLTHLEEDVRAIGVLLGAITENYEGYNAVFQYASILSNHRAPSQDIAVQIAEQEALRHRLTRGW
ncbi:hypothetical protein K435DRAFT_868003 [Dendrothele bispora CBS 962.96]|uniref:Uncharacterized protein n=1 Tax=Dendrothele bispora (strain CBS 962.96) TaxID=1314807 RepID=A0A4S8LCV1_DENBC|nr:hypothetical protein K435DRAFT_868003 [Dendrothele bispora CBS 962.96]